MSINNYHSPDNEDKFKLNEEDTEGSLGSPLEVEHYEKTSAQTCQGCYEDMEEHQKDSPFIKTGYRVNYYGWKHQLSVLLVQIGDQQCH